MQLTANAQVVSTSETEGSYSNYNLSLLASYCSYRINGSHAILNDNDKVLIQWRGYIQSLAYMSKKFYLHAKNLLPYHFHCRLAKVPRWHGKLNLMFCLSNILL